MSELAGEEVSKAKTAGQRIPGRRVVVTAAGVVSPLGLGLSENLESLRAGRDGIAPITLFQPLKPRCTMAGQVDTQRLRERYSRKSAPHRASLMMIAAIEELAAADPHATPEAAVIGTTSGGMSFGEEYLRILHGMRSSFSARALLANYPPQKAVMDALEHCGWNIPFTIIANACASGTNAVGEAYRLVRSGIRNCLLCGGYDALSELVYLGFDCLQASTQEKVRPFDRDRTGLALGEGAALVIVESYESARARNAPVLGEIIGYGLATDNYHLTQPHPSGIGPQRSMQRAFEDAGLNGDGVDYVNAHGTATRFNDSTEAIAIRSVTPDAVVSSTKSMMGHALGAAGAVEMVFSLLSLAEGFVPPNINFQQGDSETPLHIAEKPVSRVLTRVASNSFGFGGTNATIVLASQKAGPELPSPASDNGSGVFIAGMGWVTPAGGDLRTVLDRLRANIPCDPKPVECLTYNRPLRAISVDPGLTQHLGRHPRLRRASPISYYAVAAGTAAMEHAGIAADPERTAVVFAAATGSVQYTRRFYEGILREGAPGASPVLFPETGYNAPASHLAAALGITGPTLTLVGDGSIGLTALQFGADLLESDHGIDHVLVVGAEEMDPATVAAYSDWELFQPEESPGSVALSEGGAAVVLARTGPWELVGACGGIPFRRRSGRAVLEETLFRFRQASPSCVYAGFNGTPCDALERDVIEAVFPESPIRAIKHILGEPLGAGALMQTIAACLESAEGYHAGREAVVTSAGLNRQFGAAWIRHCGGGLA